MAVIIATLAGHDKILKGNEIVYDKEVIINQFNSLNEKELLCHLRKIQMEKVSELIQNESGITIQFNDSIEKLKLLYIIDETNNPIDLIDFMETYKQEKQLLQLMKKKL